MYYSPEFSEGPLAMGKQGQLFIWHNNGGEDEDVVTVNPEHRVHAPKHTPKAN